MRTHADRARASDAGFSIVEVLVAASLLIAGVAALASLFTLSVQSGLASRHRTHAAILAQSKLAELRARPVPSGGADVVTPSGQADDPTGPFVRRWWVESSPLGPQGRIVRVDVAHVSDTASTHGVSLATVLDGGAP